MAERESKTVVLKDGIVPMRTTKTTKKAVAIFNLVISLSFLAQFKSK